MSISSKYRKFNPVLFGIMSSMDAEQKRKVLLCNAISLSIALLSFFILINDYFFAKNILAGHRRLIVFLFLMAVPFLNKFGYTVIAKIILVFVPGFTVFIIPILIKDFFAGQLLWFHYGTAIMSAIPILLFHHKFERIQLWLFFTFYLFLTVFIDRLLLHFNDQDYGLELITSDFTDYKIPPIFLSLIFSAVVYWFNSININYSHKLSKTNDDLRYTNEELLSKTAELDELNQKLEIMVQERTAIIVSKEKQIIEYANINAHKVRGPLARILGLINISSHSKNEGELKELITKMNFSAGELNTIITEMNEILSDTD